MRHLDLFSGIGGFALAARWNKWQTVQFVEMDDFCQRVLAKNFPEVPIHADIKTFTGKPGSADIITGGFPCQPFSHAGKRRGGEDDRALWPEMLRVIKEVRPSWVLGENVAGLISISEENMGIDAVLSDMEAEGYETQAFIIPACAVDAPHRRDRVWILGANTNNPGSTTNQGKHERTKERHRGCSDKLESRNDVSYTKHNAGCSEWRVESRKWENKGPHKNSVSAGSSEDVADTEGKPERAGFCESGTAGQRRGRSGDGRGQDVPITSGARSQEREGQTGERTHTTAPGGCRWPTEPDVGRVVDGVSTFMDCIGGIPIGTALQVKKGKNKSWRTLRLKGLGNAVVPQIPAIIMAMIDECSRQ